MSGPGVCQLYQFLAQFLFMAPWFSFLGERTLQGFPFYSPGLMLDRLYAIKKPINYRNTLNSRVSKSIAACWALALLPTLPLWFDSTMAEDWDNGCKCYFPLRNVSKQPS